MEICLVKLQNLKNSKLVAQTNKYRPGFYEWFHFNLSIAIDQIYKWQKFCVAKPSSLFSRISVEKTFNFLNINKRRSPLIMNIYQKNPIPKILILIFFVFLKSAQKFEKNLSLVLTLLSKRQNKWDIFFQIVAFSQCFNFSFKISCWLLRICIFLVIIIRLIGYLGCQQNMLLGVKFTVFLNKIEGVKISILFFCTHSYNQSHSI